MSRASLRQIKLNGADFASELLFYGKLKRLACAGKILMTENVDCAALSAFTDVGSVRRACAFRNRNDNVRMLFKRCGNILVELFIIKRNFGEIYKIRSDARKRGKSRCGGEPSCVASHYFYYCNGFYRVNSRIEKNFLRYGCDVFRSGTEAGRVVGAGKVVVYCFWNTDNSDL